MVSELFTHRLRRNIITVKPIDVFSFDRLKKMSVECYGLQLEMWSDFMLAHPTIEKCLEFVLMRIGRRTNKIKKSKSKYKIGLIAV